MNKYERPKMILKDNDPISVVLITSGSRGHRLLFRFPYEEFDDITSIINHDLDNSHIDLGHNPYKLTNTLSKMFSPETNIQKKLLFGFQDSLLASILAPKLVCERNFELTIEHIKFVGYPVLIDNENVSTSSVEDCPLTSDKYENDEVMIHMVHIVFAVPYKTHQKIVSHLQIISKMVGKALRHEEKRCCYLKDQRRLMVAQNDLLETLPESEQNLHEQILKHCELAKHLVMIYESMCNTGIIKVDINNWLTINYCLPHKIHEKVNYENSIDMNKFNMFVNSIKPYHTLLLTDECPIPNDASPALARVINCSRHVKSFQTLCQDADISLPQIYQICAHLLYWGKCTIIYPLAESNLYVVSENAETAIDSKYAEDFVKSFPKQSLHNVLARFSFPITLGENRIPYYNVEQVEQAKIVTWLLKRRLLKQLHTYVWIMPQEINRDEEDSYLLNIRAEKLRHYADNLELRTSERRTFERFSLLEKQNIFRIGATVDREDIIFFIKMSKYFRGEHHLEHIMYYENVPRSKLLVLIDKFRSMLLTVQHEDLATSKIKEF